jgi:hypothetical protein
MRLSSGRSVGLGYYQAPGDRTLAVSTNLTEGTRFMNQARVTTTFYRSQ